MTKTKTALKHCPFCGYYDHIIEVNREEPFGPHATIACNICGANIVGPSVLVGDDSDEELIISATKLWNGRRNPVE